MPLTIDPTLTAPTPPTTITSADGFLKATADPAYAGVILRSDFSTIAGTYIVRFFRGDGSASRGGDPAFAPGGFAYAYDNEVPLGEVSSWYAIAYDFEGAELQVSDTVALDVPAPATGLSDPGCWVKSIEEPTLSVQCMINDWTQVDWEVFSTVDHISGRKYSLGTFDTVGGFTASIKLLTMTAEQSDLLLATLQTGLVLVQPAPIFGKPQGFVIVTSISMNDTVKMRDVEKYWTIGVNQVDRPDTFAEPTRWPGHTFADRKATFPLFQDAITAGGTFGDRMLP
jgi:hypothetical protein